MQRLNGLLNSSITANEGNAMDNKELLIKAFLEAEKMKNSKVPSEEKIEWNFSEKFKKSMGELMGEKIKT